MASIRKFKKEVSYLVNEVISDAYVALYFQPETHRDAIVEVISQTAELNNELVNRINHPEEKHNPRLLKKYYAAVRNDMFVGIDAAFENLSAACAKAASTK